jgi:hypothetical protein
VHKGGLMADRRPQKVGAYERPARMKGMIIGVVVLIALIVLAILFFSGRRAGAAAFGVGGGHAVRERSSGARQGWLVRDGAPARTAYVQ